MGYRNEVALALRKTDYEKLMEIAKEELNELYYLDIKPINTVIDGHTYTLLHWDWVKWGGYIKEVSIIENFIRDIPHSFIRIGEDIGDNETDISIEDTNTGEADDGFYDLLCLDRSIGISPFMG